LHSNVTVYLLNNYRFIQITQQEMTLAFLLFYNLPVKMWIITGQPAMLNKLPWMLKWRGHLLQSWYVNSSIIIVFKYMFLL